MKIEYVSHSTLLVDTGDQRILFDPWWNGPAYCEQWYVFPQPVRTEHLLDVDAVMITHGHEDHLHAPTLEQVSKDAHVFYPYNWYGGATDYFHSLGFRRVTEAVTLRSIELTPRTTITYVANNLDSIVVIEANGLVLVNVNDALHAYHPRVIELFTKSIRARWPKIDYVFAGFGGASYFPNCLHVPGKDNQNTSLLREQLFAHNFCRIVAGLEPSIAVPFAADFALLDPEKLWINRARYGRENIPAYYRAQFANQANRTTILPMYSGDVLQGASLVETSPYRERVGKHGLLHLLDEQYGQEIAHKVQQKFEFTDADSADRLEAELRANIELRAPLFDPQRLDRLEFTVRVTDIEQDNCFVVTFKNGAPQLTRTAEPSTTSAVILDVRSSVLRYSFGSEWGGDAIVIGYGVELQIANAEAVQAGFDTMCVRLLTRHPSAKRFMAKNIGRATKHFYTNPLARSFALQSLTKRLQPDMYDSRLWLSRTKCEICEICDMPLLTEAFSQTLSG